MIMDLGKKTDFTNANFTNWIHSFHRVGEHKFPPKKCLKLQIKMCDV